MYKPYLRVILMQETMAFNTGSAYEHCKEGDYHES